MKCDPTFFTGGERSTCRYVVVVFRQPSRVHRPVSTLFQRYFILILTSMCFRPCCFSFSPCVCFLLAVFVYAQCVCGISSTVHGVRDLFESICVREFSVVEHGWRVDWLPVSACVREDQEIKNPKGWWFGLGEYSDRCPFCLSETVFSRSASFYRMSGKWKWLRRDSPLYLLLHSSAGDANVCSVVLGICLLTSKYTPPMGSVDVVQQGVFCGSHRSHFVASWLTLQESCIGLGLCWMDEYRIGYRSKRTYVYMLWSLHEYCIRLSQSCSLLSHALTGQERE